MPEAIPRVRVSAKINGKPYSREVEPRTLLVQFLREELSLTGTHIGCDTSYCGACTVLLNGKSVKSCTVFAFQADGGEVLTVEGLAKDGELHPVQQAFSDCSRLPVRLLHARLPDEHAAIAAKNIRIPQSQISAKALPAIPAAAPDIRTSSRRFAPLRRSAYSRLKRSRCELGSGVNLGH